MAGAIKRIRFDPLPPRRRERPQTIGVVVPYSGPFKGQRIAVYKRGTSGLFGTDAEGVEVYIFHHELQPPTRRIK